MAKTNAVRSMVVPLVAHGKKCGVAHQRADVELAPAAVPTSSSYSARSQAAAALAGSRAQLRRIAQAERAVDEQRAALRKRSPSSTRRSARRRRYAGAEELGEIDDAVEVAAHVATPLNQPRVSGTE